MQGLVVKTMRENGHSLSFKEFLALMFISLKTDGITPGEIAKKFTNDKALISRMTVKLRDLGYISIKDNPSDKRSSKLFLSRKGKQLQVEVSQVIWPIEKKMIDSIGSKEFESFMRVLIKMRSFIQNVIN